MVMLFNVQMIKFLQSNKPINGTITRIHNFIFT